jgi:hypothetical protein
MHANDNNCSGFVQTNPIIPLDKVLGPVSAVRGPQHYAKLAVTQVTNLARVIILQLFNI